MTSDTLTVPDATAPATRRGLRRFLANHPVLIDVSVAVIYVLILLPGLVHGLIFSVDTSTAQAGTGLAATLGVGAALVFRRRAPIIVLATVIVLVLVIKTLAFGFIDPLALAIAGYAAGAYLPQRRAWITTAAASVVVVLLIIVGAPLSDALEVDTLLILNLVLFVPACLIGLLVNVLSKLREAEELRLVHHMQEQVQAAELTAVQQRAVLSREMHDVVGHSLTAIINVSDGALRASTLSPELLEEGLRRINGIARDALGETRTILGTLRPDGETALRTPTRTPDKVTQPESPTEEPEAAELGIRELLDNAESTGLTTRLIVNGQPAPRFLSDEVRTGMYRIVQEATTNVMRHAKDATLITVTLAYTPENLTVQVHDNGNAIPTSAGAGNGLHGATERAQLLGGTLHAGAAPGGGWHVTATIPAHQEVAS